MTSVRLRIRLRAGVHAAFSLVETMMAIVIVGGLFVAAINTVGASRMSMRVTELNGHGVLLARDLMSEILANGYVEPDESPTWGPESSEITGSRVGFDDVDDYHGWTAFPPRHRDGTALAGAGGWRRSVMVEYTEVDDPTRKSLTDQGIKRITVVLTFNGAEVTTLAALRTAALDEMESD